MGLDGISVNQLRVTTENNSAEMNRIARNNAHHTKKIVDSVSSEQKINPDKDDEGNIQTYGRELEAEEEIQEELPQDIVKYDLSESDKYNLELENGIDDIIIIEKKTGKIVQRINAEKMASFISPLASSQGAMINRKL